MGRGVSCGGGQSSLGYLFAGGESQEAPSNPRPTKSEGKVAETATPEKTTPPPQTVDGNVPAGIPGSKVNNYYRADGQNCGNFITDRPTTKVHAAPGGGSSLGYLFGGDGNSIRVCRVSPLKKGAAVADAAEATFWIRGDANRSGTGAIPCESSSGNRCLVADYAEEFLPMDLGTSRMLPDKNDDGSIGYAALFEAPLQAASCGRGSPYIPCLAAKNNCTKGSPCKRACEPK